jgi:stage V sporulation protein G
VEITEVRIKLMSDPNDRLMGFCSITLDGSFVIRDLKIIQGGKGSFVAMPSRRLMDRCARCHTKNHLRARFCNHCGEPLKEDRALKDGDGRAKLYADIAHPINCECREKIQAKVMEAFEQEKILAQQEGYVCRYDDYGEDDYYDDPPMTTPFTRRDEPHREATIRIDQPQRSEGPATPHVLKMPAIAPDTVNARRGFENSEESFGSGID